MSQRSDILFVPGSNYSNSLVHNRRVSDTYPYFLPGSRNNSDDIVYGLTVMSPGAVTSVPYFAPLCMFTLGTILHTFSVSFKSRLCVPATGPRPTNLRGISYRNQCFKLNWRQVLLGMLVASCFHLYNPTADSETRIPDWMGSVTSNVQRLQWLLYSNEVNTRQERR